MKSKLLSILGIVVAILLGWLAICVALDPKEPNYGGHTLSQWLILYYDTFGPYTSENQPRQFDAQVQASEKAVKIIGTNAIPTALRWLSKKYDVRDYFHISAFKKGYPLNGMAETIFEILGDSAQPAVPSLIQIIKNGKDAKTRIVALRLLEKIDKNRTAIVSVFLESAKRDKDAKVRDYALNVVVQEVGLDRKTGHELTSALLNDPDKNVRHNAKLFNDKANFFFPDSSGDTIETNNVQNK